MSAFNPEADDKATLKPFARSMQSENTAPVVGAIDPAAITLLGTYVIDLTATTHSDSAVPDRLPTTVS